MTDDRSIERAARTWLERGPNQAPERAVQAALLRIESTPQERDWHWPWSGLRIDRRVGATVAIAVIAIALVGGSTLLPAGPKLGPTAQPAPTASPSARATPQSSASPSAGATPQSSALASPATTGLPAFTRTFVSDRYGFSVRYPDRWQARRAAESWVFGLTTSWGAATVDDLHGADVRLSAASQPLKPGETPAGRLQAMIGASPVCQARVPGPATVLVGDQPGTVAVNGCSSASPAFFGGISPRGYFYVVVLVLDNRAYEFILDGAVDPAYLQAMLATVALDPSSAVDPGASP